MHFCFIKLKEGTTCLAETMREKRILKEDEEERSRGEFLLGSDWKLWTYSISELRVDNLSKEGRALTVTNNYFWQLFNSQTYCAGAVQLSYGSIKTEQLRHQICIKHTEKVT